MAYGSNLQMVIPRIFTTFSAGVVVAPTLPALQETIKISITTNSTGIFTMVSKLNRTEWIEHEALFKQKVITLF